MRKVRVWTSAFVLLILLSAALFIFFQHDTIASSLPPYKFGNIPHDPSVNKASTSLYITGVPAIPVNPSAQASGDTSSTPAFTKADVEKYLQTHEFHAGPLAPGAHLKILTIQFMTAKQASDLMYGETTSRPDDYLVCYVKVQGPFVFQGHGGPSQDAGEKPRHLKSDWGEAVYDAHTGNMLVWGMGGN